MPDQSSSTSVVSFDGNVKSFPKVTNGEYTKEGFIQQCAMTLFCNTSFELTKESPKTIAKKCYERAKVLADMIFKK